MINKSDAVAALNKSHGDCGEVKGLGIIDEKARLVLESIFDGRDRISIEEARVARFIMARAETALMGAIATAYETGDTADDEEPSF